MISLSEYELRSFESTGINHRRGSAWNLFLLLEQQLLGSGGSTSFTTRERVRTLISKLSRLLLMLLLQRFFPAAAARTNPTSHPEKEEEEEDKVVGVEKVPSDFV